MTIETVYVQDEWRMTVCLQDEWRIDYRRRDSMWVLSYKLTGWSMDFWSLHEAIDAMEIYASEIERGEWNGRLR